MPDRGSVRVVVDGVAVSVTPECTVAAAVLNSGTSRFRVGVGGTPRGPICGMGVCFECRVTIDGAAHQRACRVLCRDGMEVQTGE